MRRFTALAFATFVAVSALGTAMASAQQYYVPGYWRAPPGHGCGGFGCR